MQTYVSTMSTKRDRVWRAALRLSERRGNFTANDVVESLGEDPPSEVMIHDCLQTMVEFGLLEVEEHGGSAPNTYHPPTGDGDPFEQPTQSPPANIVSTFPYPGGKGRVASWILEKLPAHDCYVEVFGGSASLLYNKPPSHNEVYNDVNDDLVQFFRVLRNKGDELAEWLSTVPFSRSQYEQWATEYYDGYRPEDGIERAGRFFTLRYMQVAGHFSGVNGFKTRAERSPAQTFDNARKRLESLANRFSQVVIENKDYTDVLEDYDSDDVDVFFYCDPPYVRKEDYYGGGFDHDRFLETLFLVNGDWMVSYANLPERLKDYYVFEREHEHQMNQDSKTVTERLVCNFDPSERPRFVSAGHEQATLDSL